jgi:hypothetical protein
MSQYKLVFDATNAGTDFAANFFEKQIRTIVDVTARSETDFALTGSNGAVHALVTDQCSTTITIDPIPQECLVIEGETTGKVTIKHDARLNLTNVRIGTSVSGVLCRSFSGQGQ